MKVMAVSDMHGKLEGLDPKDADLVIIAGDFGIMKGWGVWHMNDQVKWINKKFAPWCEAHPGTEFCVIPGNHDLFAQHPEVPTKPVWPANVHFLVDDVIDVKGLRIAGVPWVPPISGKWAFETRDEEEMAHRLANVPEGVDVLVTHSPPRIEGRSVDCSLQTGRGPFGSPALTEAILRIRPRYVFCGHIHSGDHAVHDVVYPGGCTKVYNVSRVDENYEIAYEPTVVFISPRTERETMELELDSDLADALRAKFEEKGLSLEDGVGMMVEEIVSARDLESAVEPFCRRVDRVTRIR